MAFFVQVNAAAAVCNLVLEFSSVKSAVLHHGGVQKLVELTGSPVATLRLHAAWALRNLLYQSDLALKQSVVRALPWPSMRQLLYDPEPPIQEQAVCILRNLCMSAAEHIQMAASWAGPDLMSVLEEKLDPTNRWVAPSMLVHALYTVVNILTGSEAHKAAVMLSNLPVLLLHHMRSSASAEVRLPTVWCVINLTWPEPGQDVASRTRRLKELGFEEALRALANDASLDVRERVKTALDQLRLSHAPAAAL